MSLPIFPDVINSLKYYPVTRDIAKLADEYIRQFGEKGVTLSLADATIGAIATDCLLPRQVN